MGLVWAYEKIRLQNRAWRKGVDMLKQYQQGTVGLLSRAAHIGLLA